MIRLFQRFSSRISLDSGIRNNRFTIISDNSSQLSLSSASLDKISTTSNHSFRQRCPCHQKLKINHVN